MARATTRSNGQIQEEIPKAKLNAETLREGLVIFSYIKPYRLRFATGLLFIGLSALTTMAFPYLLKQLIDSANPVGTSRPAFSPGTIALMMMGVLTIQMFFSFMRVYTFTWV